MPVDRALYDKIKAKVYKEVPQHSAYRSGLVVQQYKAAGGKYSGSRAKGSLHRWFKEDWRNQRGGKGYKRKGDVYRPTRRVSSKTPKTFQELGKGKITKAMREKSSTGRVRSFDKSDRATPARRKRRASSRRSSRRRRHQYTKAQCTKMRRSRKKMTPAQKRSCATHRRRNLKGGGGSHAADAERASILARNLETLENDITPSPRSPLSGGGGKEKPYEDFPWMTYAKARRHEDEAAKRGVSQVARSSRGFMRHYEKMRTKTRMKQALVPGKRSQTWGEA